MPAMGHNNMFNIFLLPNCCPYGAVENVVSLNCINLSPIFSYPNDKQYP
jgi:hypothetical protein